MHAYEIICHMTPCLPPRVEHHKAVLLYGAGRTGKSMLVHAVASSTGATLLNLSPAHTDGRYPGKEVATLVSMVTSDAELNAVQMRTHSYAMPDESESRPVQLDVIMAPRVTFTFIDAGL